MGTKASRESPTASYPNHRLYATWKHQGPLVSDDLPRLVNQQLQNFQEHPPAQFSSLPPTSQAKIQHRVQSPGKVLGLRKSRSTADLLHSNTLITAEQLLKDQAKRRQQHRSPSVSSISSMKKSSSSLLSVNRMKTKKLPKNLQFVLINPNQLTVSLFTLSFLLFLVLRTVERSAKATSALFTTPCTKVRVMWL